MTKFSYDMWESHNTDIRGGPISLSWEAFAINTGCFMALAKRSIIFTVNAAREGK